MKFIFIFFILTLFQFNFSQGIEKQVPSIDIVGLAENEIIPDEIYVSITIRERIEGKERITLEKQENDFKEILKKIGIDLSLLSLSDANADYIKIKYKHKDVLSQMTYILKLNTAKSVGDLFSALFEIKIYDAFIQKVSHSKIEEFKKDLRILAIKNAKEKAEYLTTAIGYEIGKPIIIYENSPINFNQYEMNQPVYSTYQKDAITSVQSYEPQVEISFKKIKLEASIFVKFELK
jgi:uncharacterized protein YggE